MRKHVLAAVAAAAVLLTTGGAALADWAGPTGATALAAQPVPAGSLWQVGGAPACRAVDAPPEAPVGEAVILVGQPGQPDQWCGSHARLGPGGTLQLPGGIPGERLSPTQYARETGATVIIAYTPHGRTVVYLPA